MSELQQVIQGIERIERRVDKMDGRVDRINDCLGSFEKKTDAKFDKVIASITHMDYYMRNELATKDELHEVKHDLISHMDWAVTSDAATKDETKLLQKRLGKAEKKIGLTGDALASA